MNKQRRKNLGDIINELETQRDLLQSLQEEEQEAFDNLPEGLQYGERGQTMQECADDMDAALSVIDDVISDLQDILSR